MKDLFGKALRDYHNNNYTEDLITSTNISDDDVLPLTYLFRSFSEMPKLEQKALKLAIWKSVMKILFFMQELKLKITALKQMAEEF